MLVSKQMEGALSPSDASTDFISSHFPFSTWHRHREMDLDLHPPSSPRRLLTSLFSCDLTAAIAAQHFATCHRDEPGPSLAVTASLFDSLTLLFWGGARGGRIEIQHDKVESWSGARSVGFLCWFISTLPDFLPSLKKLFRLSFVPNIAKSGAVPPL